jgi:glycosyltransferase involved in cell wall biosynthesis
MRVTILLRCLAMMHGGGETRHLAWARELRRAGDEVTIITGRPLLAAPRFAQESAVVVVRSPYVRDLVYRFQRTRGLGRGLARLLRADEHWFCRVAWRQILRAPASPDIVHAHALAPAARLRRGPIPTVINLPGMADRRDIPDLQLADAIIADGWAAEHLPAALGRGVEHVPKGVDVDTFRPDGPNWRAALGLEGKRVALVVSRLVPIKNVQLAVDALAAAAADRSDIVLAVVGDGPLRGALDAQVAARGLTGRVVFAGRVPHEQTPAWYRTADVFVLPSEFDNSPNVALEAMASGVPVVATDVGGLRHYVRSGLNGDLVPAGDPAALGRAMVRYVDDQPLRTRVGRRNRDDATAGFSWAQSAQALRAVYARVIARAQAARTSLEPREPVGPITPEHPARVEGSATSLGAPRALR